MRPSTSPAPCMWTACAREPTCTRSNPMRRTDRGRQREAARREVRVTPRVIFLGTPAFAVPSLDALGRLHEAGAIKLVAVVTQPDRPANRGRVTAPPVKDRAASLNVPILQPVKLTRASVDEIVPFG